jgi:hypothetical protein
MHIDMTQGTQPLDAHVRQMKDIIQATVNAWHATPVVPPVQDVQIINA